MEHKIAIAAPGPIGPTFMEWSIYFLAGKNTYWHWRHSQFKDVISNPLQQGLTSYQESHTELTHKQKYLNDITNAHYHSKNVCFGSDELMTMLEKSKTVDHGVLAWHQMLLPLGISTKKTGLPLAEVRQKNNHELIKQIIQDDFTNSINFCLENNFKVIYLHMDPRIPFYFLNERRPGATAKTPVPKITNPDELVTDNLSMIDDYNNFFYSKDAAHSIGNHIWDIREQKALDMRPYDAASYVQPIFDRQKSHYFVNCLTFWQNFEKQILEMIAWLDLEVDQTRYEQWKPIYQKWQNIHERYLDFSVRVDDIVDSIINGWHYHIGTLTFNEEAAIQHILIYKHGLNLKTWELEKFPPDAKSLHRLLETCHHPVEKIYGNQI